MKNGKFKLELEWTASNELSTLANVFLCGGISNRPLLDSGSVFKQMFYSAIWEWSAKRKISPVGLVDSYTITRSQAVAIMWLLRDADSIDLLNLKSSLHKKLIGI